MHRLFSTQSTSTNNQQVDKQTVARYRQLYTPYRTIKLLIVFLLMAALFMPQMNGSPTVEATPLINHFEPTALSTDSGSSYMNALATGMDHTCAVTASGGIQCWGDATDGALGNGSTSGNQTTPVDVTNLSSGAQMVKAGDSFTCALTDLGGVQCWGRNDRGQLGNGSTTNQATPVDVSSLTSGVIGLALGQDHACALTSGGAVKCWGDNQEGQLGNDTTSTSPNTSVQNVFGLSSGVTMIAAGSNHTCALMDDDSVECWGDNEHGQLGDGTVATEIVPESVIGLGAGSGVTALSAGGSHTCALLNTGGVKCWGSNSHGQLGDGSTAPQNTPIDVPTLTSGVKNITTGASHTCALLTDGTVKCWGSNTDGQLGNGDTVNQSTPVDVIGLADDVNGIAASHVGNQTCALLDTGGIQCWGNNDNGQLGNGSTTDTSTPATISGFTGVVTPVRIAIPDGIQGVSGQEVIVPIKATLNGTEAGSTAFTMLFDTACLTLNSADNNGDNIPDTIVLNQATDHELEVNIDNINTGSVRMVVSPLSGGVAQPFVLDSLITITFDIACNAPSTDITLNNNDSFGDLDGQSLPGIAQGNTVWLGQKPNAVDDAGTTDEDTAFTLNLVTNDSDADNDLLGIQGVFTDDLSALVTIIPTGSITYDPNGEFESLAQGQSATEIFSYTIFDQRGLTDTALVEITINGVNDAPIAISDTVFITENQTIVINPLDNDIDVDGDDLSVITLTTPISGTIVQSGTTQLVYNPGTDFEFLGAGISITISVGYTASDEHGLTSQENIIITVNGAGDTPSTRSLSDTVRTAPGVPVLIDATQDDVDPDSGDTLTIISITQPDVGIASIRNDINQIVYTPTATFFGIQTFDYVIADSTNLTATGQVTVAVGIAGDCNQDGVVDAGDLTACVVEVFDNDTDFWLRVPQGSFLGNPVGCDANADNLVGAGDLSCKVLKVLEGESTACATTVLAASTTSQPAGLVMGSPTVRATSNGLVEVDIRLNSHGHAINSAILEVAVDNDVLTFQKATGTQGEYGQLQPYVNGDNIGLAVYEMNLDGMADGAIATLTFETVNDNVSHAAIRKAVQLTSKTSLGSVAGQRVPYDQMMEIFLPLID
ncbi:MAG: tandem-95 repeat protein [Chloroflexota bacterium]